MGDFDAIVVGSGVGGLACAAALAKARRRVLVLEQHFALGGLTQTFSRAGFSWSVGVHYLGDMGQHGGARAVLDWLCNDRIEMATTGDVYDTVHLPDGFEIQFSRPETALKRDLTVRFPHCASEIDAFFDMMKLAAPAGKALFAERAMPSMLARVHEIWHRREIQHWWGRTTMQVVKEAVSDPKLQAVLLAQRGDYGDPPGESSFGMHATVMRHYMNGAYYPVGGSGVFAKAFIPTITAAGGEVRTRSRVTHLLYESGRVVGVQLAEGAQLRAPCVFSDAGALNTTGHLLPAAARNCDWVREIQSFRPSVCHIALYLGLEGNIQACGASASNHWFYEAWELDSGVWSDPSGQSTPPQVFVSFPSLKDPSHDPGPRQRHTAEIAVATSWQAFSQWEDSKIGKRPVEYGALKEHIERNLLAQFARHFPALSPLIVCHELSTPLSTSAFTGAPQGAMYGLETTPRRFLSPSLRARTPIPGLYLTGQDVMTPGVVGAMMGGVLAASALDPRLLPHAQAVEI